MDRHIYIVLVAVLAVLSARNIEEGGRDARDLVLENMVMRSTKFSPQVSVLIMLGAYCSSIGPH